MTSPANQAFDAHPNVLRGQTIPNTMGGLGLPVVATRLRIPARAFVAAGGVILAGLMIALALVRAA